MKIRSGFISNSSSSSFVISVPKGKAAKLEIKLVYDARERAEHILKNKKELESYMDKEFGRDWEKFYGKDVYEPYLAEIMAGREVLICEVSNDSEDAFETIVYEQGGAECVTPLDKDVKIIAGDEE